MPKNNEDPNEELYTGSANIGANLCILVQKLKSNNNIVPVYLEKTHKELISTIEKYIYSPSVIKRKDYNHLVKTTYNHLKTVNNNFDYKKIDNYKETHIFPLMRQSREERITNIREFVKKINENNSANDSVITQSSNSFKLKK